MSRRKYMVLILGFMMLSLVLVYPILYLPRADVIRDRGVPVIQTSDHEPNRSLIIKELDVTVSMHPEEILELKRQSREFNEHYPNIVINIVDIPYPEAYKTLKNAGRIGESSDIMLLDNTWVNDFAASGLLKPADAVFNGEMLADQLNRLLQPLKWNGYVWAVPKDADPLVAVWNRKLLEAAGFDSPPAKWSDFLRLTEQLTALEDQSGAIIRWINLDPEDAGQWRVWFSSLEESPEDPSLPVSLIEDRLERVSFVQTASPRIGNLSISASGDRLIAELKQGTVLSAVVPWSEASLAENDLVLGGNAEERPLWVNGRSFAISSGTALEEEARLWIEYVTSAEAQSSVYRLFQKLPSRKSLYNSFTSDSPPIWLRNRLEEEPESKPDPVWLRQHMIYAGLIRQWRNGELKQEFFVRAWNDETS